MKGFIVYQDYDTIGDKTRIKLFGRLENGQTFLTINEIKPYFFIKEEDLKKIEKYLEKFEIEKTNLSDFDSKKVIKISSNSQTEINKLSQLLSHIQIKTYEADIKPVARFMIDNDILSSIEIEGEYNTSERIDRIYINPKIKSAKNFKPRLKIASIDIESDKHTGKLISIAIVSDNYQKIFFVSNHELEKTASFKTEQEALLKFKEELIKLDPDIITGWNIVSFDLLYLQEIFEKHKIGFDLGRTNEKARLRISNNYLKPSSADIPGRIVLDGIALIKDPFIQQAPTMRYSQFESYSLEDVSQAILGKGKLLKGTSRHDEIEKLYKENKKSSHQKIADYNLNDAKLVLEIIEKTKIVEIAIERSELTGMQLDRITSSISAFDSLYIREARKMNLVSPTTDFRKKEERLKGAYVYSSEAGIYKNVLVFDFKSLYPSILCTFNIDPASHIKSPAEKDKKNLIESPNGEFFKNDIGILPKIIFRLHEAREKTKIEKRELANYAIKTIMNSFWGVLASPNCRYFDLGMGNAITSFARWIIQTTSKEIEKMGFRVIYIDTDSVFVEIGSSSRTEALKKEIPEKINKFFSDLMKEIYNRKSYLELQFDKHFISMIIPQLRTGKTAKEGLEIAAKKRYAGLVIKDGKEALEITGLESIRGDWTEAAREFQKELLMRLFHNEPIEEFIKDYIKKIKSGKLDEKLVYRKSMRKLAEEYTKTTPPHVKAARLLDEIKSNVIEYYITIAGPEPIQKLKHKIDYEHYIKKQIEPIANQVLALLKKSFDEIETGSKQTKLF